MSTVVATNVVMLFTKTRCVCVLPYTGRLLELDTAAY